MKKPITPAAHGLTDYAFALALLTVPGMIGCSQRTVQFYRMIGVEILLYSALTKQPLSLLPMISMKAHRAIDVANLSGLALFTGYKGVRKNEKAKTFNMCMLALGITTVLLTRWNRK